MGGPAACGLRGGRALTAEGRLYCPRDSELAPFADGLAWLWRLGPRLNEPAPSAVGLGTARDAPALAALSAAGRLAGAVILAPGSAPATGALPARRVHDGHARFGGARADAAFTLFAGGDAVVRSTLGIHAVRGLHRLDYAPLHRLAAIGLPPTVVFHGRLLDDRLGRLRATCDLTGAARLAARPDLPRLIGLDGVRWLGAAELIEVYERHERIEVRGAEVVAPDGPAPRLLSTR